MTHTCHARGCTTSCKPEFLMCPRHWAMVPRTLQAAVWDAYRPGQCDDKRPSEAWHEAADAAIAAVALKEGCPPGKLVVDQVRAVLKLAPELFGKSEARMRREMHALDKQAGRIATLRGKIKTGE